MYNSKDENAHRYAVSGEKDRERENERDLNRYTPLREVKLANKAWSFLTKHHRKGDITRKRNKKRLPSISLQEKVTISSYQREQLIEILLKKWSTIFSRVKSIFNK